jgi:protein TonB
MERVPQTLERSGEMPAEPYLGRASGSGAGHPGALRREGLLAEPGDGRALRGNQFAQRSEPAVARARTDANDAANDAARSPSSLPTPPTLPAVLALSLGAHLVAGGLLAILPAASTFVGGEQQIEIELAILPPTQIPVPEPAIVPEPEPVAPPLPEPAPRPVRERPEPAAAAIAPEPEPEPAPTPTSAPPSIDEVFGDPAPLSALTGTGGGDAIAAGSATGAPGGVGEGRAGGSRVAASPAGPSADEIRRARRAYARAIHDLLASHARYPVSARAQRLHGRVELALRITAEGRLASARVIASSGYPLLDDAAVATAHDIAAFPAPPSLVTWDAREELRTSLVYELTR